METVNFVILCGGSGTRLWPLSREMVPKQLLSLVGNYTMLQNTIIRINKVIQFNNLEKMCKIYIICNESIYFIVNKQVKELHNNHLISIICEPIGRNTGPAICISSLIGEIDNYTIVVPSDHIFDDDEFSKCVGESFKYLDNNIVTFGIAPLCGETGYGYIKVDNNVTVQFTEKPSKEIAEKYINSGLYLWNAGIFAFKNKNMIDCYKSFCPDILNNCIETLKLADCSANIIKLSKVPFSECDSISVDYAIMEKLCNGMCNNNHDNKIGGITIIYNSFWNDIGTFKALYDECEKDINGNVNLNSANSKNNKIITMDSYNNYINSSSSKLITCIGLENLIIVDTDNALLVCKKDNTQDVSKLVNILKSHEMGEVYTDSSVIRPWGCYKNIEGDDTNGFKVKLITVYPGKRLSLQSHKYRSEHWVIVKGCAKVRVDKDDNILLKINQHVFIPKGSLHRIENIGTEILQFTETQIGEYLGEDDIIRYDDDFGRVQKN